VCLNGPLETQNYELQKSPKILNAGYKERSAIHTQKMKKSKNPKTKTQNNKTGAVEKSANSNVAVQKACQNEPLYFIVGHVLGGRVAVTDGDRRIITIINISLQNKIYRL
jgi:hypothetical protein